MDLEQLYDEINVCAFQGQLPEIPVHWSPRMIRAAGIFYEPLIGRRNAHIKLSKPLLQDRELPPIVYVAGHRCENREQVVRHVLEHEMLHVYLWVNNCENGHTEEFSRLAYERFGHTEMRHTLRHSMMGEPVNSEPFSIGARVRFPFREESVRGIILNIRRNATVMAEDERKFYVPLSILRRELEAAE